jgi:hypothetical protein
MHPLGTGDHLETALSAAGVTVRRDEARGFWTVDGAAPATVVETFLACACEPAETMTHDPDRLDDEDGDLLFYEAYWENGELVITLRRQFALVTDSEDEAYIDRLHLEFRTRGAPADTPESVVIGGAGGSDVSVGEWASRLRSDPAFAAMLGAPVDVVLFDQGPI